MKSVSRLLLIKTFFSEAHHDGRSIGCATVFIKKETIRLSDIPID